MGEADPNGYEDCIVTFIDVMGFRNLLQVRSAFEIKQVIDKLEGFTRPDAEPKPRGMKEVRLNSQAFVQSISDAVVRVRTYDTQLRDGALFWEVIDLLYAQIALINSGVLVRGGLTVGLAHVGFAGEGPIFGPALARAYEIESEEAVYPRIVLDELVLEKYDSDNRLRSESENDELYNFIAISKDGTAFIDYLSMGEKGFENPTAYYRFLENHAKLIRQGLAESPPVRIRRKYIWLANYHNAAIEDILAQFKQDREAQESFAMTFGVDPHFFLTPLLVST